MAFVFTPNIIKVMISASIAVALYLLAGLVVGIINKNVKDLKRRHSARKTTLYLATFLTIAVIIIIWIKNLNNLSVIISVVGAGLMVSLQEVIISVAGFFIIIFKKPFEIGDRIEMGGVKGDVIDIRLFQTSLLEIGNWVKEDQSTGRVVHVSNSSVFKEPLYNYTTGFEFIWNEIKITVTFESNWRKAEEIMLRYAKREEERIKAQADSLIKKMSEHYLIYYEKLTPIVYVKIVDFGVELSLRYLVEAKMRRRTQDELSRIILDEFKKEADVRLAYPTYRIVKE